MAVSGSVTLNAKVNSEEAERRLQSMAQRERELGAAASQSASSAADSYGKLTASQKELHRQSESLSGDLVKLGANLSILGVAALEAKGHLQLTQTVITGLSIAARGPLPIVAGIAAVAIAAKSASDALTYLSETAIPAAGRAEASLASLRLVTERTGGDVAATTRHVEGLEDALTGLTAAAQATRTFQSMNLSLERQAELVDAMRDGIVAMGGDVNTQLPLMALAIKRQEGELLDNMGVVSTVEQMYKNYAAAIGTTSDKLNQQQREEAVIQGVLKETAKYAGAAATAMQTYEGRIAALRTEQQKAAKEWGELVLPLANLGTEAERLGVSMERHIIRRLKEIGSPASGLAHDAQQALKSIFNQDYLIPRLSEQQQGEADMMGRTIKKLQAHNAAERSRQGQAAREGGYGPGNITDLNKFYEEKAKRDQADRERAEREAKQQAEAQKRQREQLQNDLLTIGKEGRDLELAQLKVWYDQQLEIAKGNKRNLELLEEAHRKRLQEINAKFPPPVMGGINSAAPGLSLSMGGGAGKLKLGSLGLGTWSASGGAALPSADPGSPGPEMWYASIMQATEAGLFDGVKSAAAGDFGGLGQALTTIMSKAPDPMIQALTGPAGLAITFGTMIAASFGQAAERARQYGRHLDDLASGGNLTLEQRRQREIEDDPIRKQLMAERDGYRQQVQGFGLGKDQIAAFTKAADARQAEIDAIDRVRQAAWDQADAYERLNREIERNFSMQQAKQGWADYAGSAADNLARKQLQLAMLNGTATEKDLALFDARTSGKQAREDAIRGGMQQLGLNNLPPETGRAMMNEIIAKIEGGADLTSKDAFKGTGLFGGNDFDPNSEAGKIIIGFAQTLKAAGLTQTIATEEAKRIGTSPQNPLYTEARISNLQEMMAYLAPGQLMRATGPGTRRADGMKGRAVNTRAV